MYHATQKEGNDPQIDMTPRELPRACSGTPCDVHFWDNTLYKIFVMEL